MATVLDIISRALKRINVVDAGDDPNAAEAEDGLDAYNEMIFSWLNDAVDVNHSTQALTDAFGLPQKHEMGVIALLGVRLADDYDETPTAKLLEDAMSGWIALQSDYILQEAVKFDRALTHLPSQRWWTRYAN